MMMLASARHGQPWRSISSNSISKQQGGNMGMHTGAANQEPDGVQNPEGRRARPVIVVHECLGVMYE
jgi:hypothetical protein